MHYDELYEERDKRSSVQKNEKLKEKKEQPRGSSPHVDTQFMRRMLGMVPKANA